MNSPSNITVENMLSLFLITVLIALVTLYFQWRSRKHERAKVNRLWETGATLLLGKVWGLSNDRQPDELPVIGEPAHVTREKILHHIWKSDRTDKSFEYEVCGEKVSLLLQYPNTLFGFVEKEETLAAIREAHNMMSNRDQRLFVGTIPLTLDIRVTDPDAH
jgi:hypothetical protein